MLTHEEVVERLALEAKHDSRSEVARRYGFSLSYICAVLDGNAHVSERMAEAMGYRRKWMFERLDS